MKRLTPSQYKALAQVRLAIHLESKATQAAIDANDIRIDGIQATPSKWVSVETLTGLYAINRKDIASLIKKGRLVMEHPPGGAEVRVVEQEAVL